MFALTTQFSFLWHVWINRSLPTTTGRTNIYAVTMHSCYTWPDRRSMVCVPSNWSPDSHTIYTRSQSSNWTVNQVIGKENRRLLIFPPICSFFLVFFSVSFLPHFAFSFLFSLFLLLCSCFWQLCIWNNTERNSKIKLLTYRYQQNKFSPLVSLTKFITCSEIGISWLTSLEKGWKRFFCWSYRIVHDALKQFPWSTLAFPAFKTQTFAQTSYHISFSVKFTVP